MRLYGHKGRRVLSLTTLCLVLWALSGCAMVGPRSISLGRADYNEAIDETDQRTKEFFRTMRSFWSTSIAAVAEKRPAPVLTIPAAR